MYLHEYGEKRREAMLLKRYLIGAMVLAVIVATLFSSLRVSKAQWGDPIKIGIFAPMDPTLAHWYAGYLPAAEMIAKKINDTGGIVYGGQHHAIVLGYAHEPYKLEQEGNWRQITMDSIDYLVRPDRFGADFIIGGFRTECCFVARERLVYWNQSGYTVPWFIAGAATNELLNITHIEDPSKRYDYIYRVTPINSSALFRTFGFTVQFYLCADGGPLKTLFTNASAGITKVKVAIVMEDLEWTLAMWQALVDPGYYFTPMLGPNVELVYSYRLKQDASSSEVAAVCSAIAGSGARLLLHVFSAPIGATFIGTLGTMKVPVLPVGINVVSQLQDMWTWTGGKCEYESHLMTLGTRTPMTPELVQFWDDFIAFTGGKWPVYTGIGVWDAIEGLKAAIEATNSIDPEVLHKYVCPLHSPTYQYNYMNGIGKYTESHDVFCNSFGPTWEGAENGYVRAHVCQWLDQRLEVVCPTNQEFSKVYCLPPWMYPLIWDSKNYNGKVGIDDIVYTADHFGTKPTLNFTTWEGHPRWDHRCDVSPMTDPDPTKGLYGNDKVGIDDIVAVAMHFGEKWSFP
jgi:hypothetical protein